MSKEKDERARAMLAKLLYDAARNEELRGEWVDQPVGEFIPTPYDKPITIKGKKV